MIIIDFGFGLIDIGLIFLFLSVLLFFFDTFLILLPTTRVPTKLAKIAEYSNQIFLISILLISVSFLSFLLAILSLDFQFYYVSSFVSSEMDIFLRIAAIWSGTEGSFFFWTVISVIIYFIYRRFFWNLEDNRFINRTIGFYSFQIAGLACLTLLSNPFALNKIVVTEGRGLNPILTNIWNITHPPIILIGYSLCLPLLVISVSKISVMNEGKIPEFNAQRRLNAFFEICLSTAWLLLSTGIALGAYWAYVTLGWGGFWNWDPVQTSSLVPWLFITIYYHGRSIHKENKFLENYVVSMVYIGVLFATFITRSGVLSSVHTFAPDNKVIFLFLLLGISFVLPHYLGYNNKEIFNIDLNITKNDFKINNFKQTALKFSYLSAFIGTYVLIGGLLAPWVYGSFIFLFPEVIDLFNLSSTISVDASFFNIVLAIFGGGMLILAFFCTLFADMDFKSRLYLIVLGFFASISLFAIGLGLLDPLVGSTNPLLVFLKNFLTNSDLANFLLPLLILGFIGVVVNFIQILSERKVKGIFPKGAQSLLHLSFIIIMIGAIISSNTVTTLPIEVREGDIVGVPNSNIKIKIVDLEKEIPLEGRYSVLYFIEITIQKSVIANGNRTLKFGMDRNWGVDRKATIIPILFDELYISTEFIFENEESGVFDSALIHIKYLPMISILWVGILLLHLSIIPLILQRIRILIRTFE
jgi:cytochrome c-type biogenesis protein CcmF